MDINAVTNSGGYTQKEGVWEQRAKKQKQDILREHNRFA
jgi:hypothetical protein